MIMFGVGEILGCFSVGKVIDLFGLRAGTVTIVVI
jgi:hypothetical protein